VSDAKLRDLERRWRETRSLEDEVAFLRERVRAGELARDELLALAHRQGAAALAVLGDDRDLRLVVLRACRDALVGRATPSVKVVALTTPAPIVGFLASLGHTPTVMFPLRDWVTRVGRRLTDHVPHENAGPWEGRHVFMESHQWEVRCSLAGAAIRDVNSSNGSRLVRSETQITEVGYPVWSVWTNDFGIPVSSGSDPLDLEEGDVVVSCYAAFVFGRPWRSGPSAPASLPSP
jgi:hypothetical protein